MVSKHPPRFIRLLLQEITTPIDGEGVTVNKDGMDADTYTDVMNATQEYYRQEHK